MDNYVIVTDSTCDLTDEMTKELGVPVLPLSFHIDGKDYLNYLDGREMTLEEFYGKMLAGSSPKTAQLNVQYIVDHLDPILKEGKDILYISFSSGLSGSCNAARIAKDDLLENYKNRKINIVDSLCASGGEGLLVYMTCMKKQQGASLEECTKYAEDLKLHVRHCFTVADVEYLKRGGRLKPTAAFAAKLLNIKPVLFVNNEGKLIALSKKHGRRAALNATIDDTFKGIEMNEEFLTIVSHANCLEDAEYCKNEIEAKYKELGIHSHVVITCIGPVIGAHSGPGTLAIFTIGKER